MIRSRLTVRGFKDQDVNDMAAHSATCSRWAQRLVVSEAAARRWPMALTDVPKAFLQGISYEELAAETGELVRGVSFMVPESTAEVLRCCQAVEDFDRAKEVLKCLTQEQDCVMRRNVSTWS